MAVASSPLPFLAMKAAVVQKRPFARTATGTLQPARAFEAPTRDAPSSAGHDLSRMAVSAPGTRPAVIQRTRGRQQRRGPLFPRHGTGQPNEQERREIIRNRLRAQLGLG